MLSTSQKAHYNTKNKQKATLSDPLLVGQLLPVQVSILQFRLYLLFQLQWEHTQLQLQQYLKNV